MAEQLMIEGYSSYQETEAYKLASPERRRQINRYKKENNISDEHMLLLMMKQDLENVPEDKRNRSKTASTAMLVLGVLLLWNSLQTAMNNEGGSNTALIFLSLGSFVAVAAVYYSGILDDYRRTQRRVDKGLKSMPEVPDFTTWDIEHPDKTDRKLKKQSRRRR